MGHSPISLDGLPDTCTKQGPDLRALAEANWRLQLFLNSPDELDRRFNGPPPAYRSISVTPVDEGPAEVVEDDPEVLRVLEEYAQYSRRWWLEHRERERREEQEQRSIGGRNGLGKEVEEEKRKRGEAMDRWLSAPIRGSNPNGLSADPGDSEPVAESASPIPIHPAATKARKRKLRVKNDVESHGLADSSQTPRRRATRGTRKGEADKQPNPTASPESDIQPSKNRVHFEERVQIIPPMDALESSSASSNSLQKRPRKPTKSRQTAEAKPLFMRDQQESTITQTLEVSFRTPLRRSARIAAIQSRAKEPTKSTEPLKRRRGKKAE